MNCTRLRGLLCPLVMLFTLACHAAETTSQGKPDSKPTIKRIYWDLNGVVFGTSRLGMAKEIGIWTCTKYMVTHFKSVGHIKQLMFKVLDATPVDDTTRDKYKIPTEAGEPPVTEGLPMPKLMQYWMLGMPGKEIISLTHSAINAGTFNHLFSSRREKHLVKKLIRTMFNPEILARNTYVLEEGLKLLEACYQQPDITNWVLSNRAREVIEKLKETTEGKRVFTCFDKGKILLSSDLKRMKPHNYENIKKMLEDEVGAENLNTQEYLFIDDDKKNVEAARKAGFQAILVENGDFVAVRKQLVELKVIGG